VNDASSNGDDAVDDDADHGIASTPEDTPASAAGSDGNDCPHEIDGCVDFEYLCALSLRRWMPIILSAAGAFYAVADPRVLSDAVDAALALAEGADECGLLRLKRQHRDGSSLGDKSLLTLHRLAPRCDCGRRSSHEVVLSTSRRDALHSAVGGLTKLFLLANGDATAPTMQMNYGNRAVEGVRDAGPAHLLHAILRNPDRVVCPHILGAVPQIMHRLLDFFHRDREMEPVIAVVTCWYPAWSALRPSERHWSTARDMCEVIKHLRDYFIGLLNSDPPVEPERIKACLPGMVAALAFVKDIIRLGGGAKELRAAVRSEEWSHHDAVRDAACIFVDLAAVAVDRLAEADEAHTAAVLSTCPRAMLRRLLTIARETHETRHRHTFRYLAPKLCAWLALRPVDIVIDDATMDMLRVACADASADPETAPDRFAAWQGTSATAAPRSGSVADQVRWIFNA